MWNLTSLGDKLCFFTVFLRCSMGIFFTSLLLLSVSSVCIDFFLLFFSLSNKINYGYLLIAETTKSMKG
jgi:hypothetical protein